MEYLVRLQCARQPAYLSRMHGKSDLHEYAGFTDISSVGMTFSISGMSLQEFSIISLHRYGRDIIVCLEHRPAQVVQRHYCVSGASAYTGSAETLLYIWGIGLHR
jgi:hypothetical protein